jgi:uncharacterized protein YjdB
MKPKFPTKYIAFTTYFSSSHQAVDIPNGVTVNNKMMDNKPVYMTHDGKVITNSYASDYGYFIEYEYYEDGVRYVVGDGHFNSPSNLQVGKTYSQGTFIQNMGNKGTSSATHDHHRLSRNGTRVNPLDYEYVYPDQVVGQYETAKLKYYTPPQPKIKYRAHVQNKGWLPWVSDGQTAGTTGEALRLEAIQIDYSGTIEASGHSSINGWQNFGKINKNTVIGTIGERKALECLKLKGTIEYRVHIQNSGWSCWTLADGICTLGSVGEGVPIEAIQIRVRG